MFSVPYSVSLFWYVYVRVHVSVGKCISVRHKGRSVGDTGKNIVLNDSPPFRSVIVCIPHKWYPGVASEVLFTRAECLWDAWYASTTLLAARCLGGGGGGI